MDYPISETLVASRQATAKTLQILIVEDSQDDFALINYELSRLSQPFSTIRVECREDLIKALKEQHWDVVISDHNLPQLNSAAVLQVLRQFAPHTPLILVTGSQAENSVLHLALEGADDYIFKHHLARLVPSINRTLRVQQAQAQQLKAQRALHTSLQQLQTLVAAAPLGIIACDAEGNITLWNETASKILGYKAEEMLGQATAKMPLNDPRLLLISRLEVLYRDLQEGVPNTKLAALVERQDGALLDIEIHAALLTDSEHDSAKPPQAQGMVVIVNDLTDLHATQLARRESEARFSAVSGNLPGAVFQLLYNTQAKSVVLTSLTDGAQQLFERPATHFIQQPPLFLSLLPEEDKNSLLYELNQCTHQQELVRWEGRVTLPHDLVTTSEESERYRWIYIAASPRKLSAEYTQWDGIMIDLSQQKEMELKLRRSEEELRALAANVEKAKEEERAYVAREVHDDIGGTLSKLKADVALLRKAVGNDPAVIARLIDMDQLLDHTVEGTRRIARALRPGILDYGVIPALEWQAGDFSERTGIKTKFTSNQEEVSLDAEQSTALFRIVQESLTNILKYAEATEVFIEVFVEPADINIEVRDNGRGMAADAVEKQQSFGIRGMRERALALGGWVDINSAPNAGTTVMLSIPLQRRIERRKRPRLDKPQD